MVMIIKINVVDYTNECQEGTFLHESSVTSWSINGFIGEPLSVNNVLQSVAHTVGLAVQWYNRNH